jgi:hypothetical protein
MPGTTTCSLKATGRFLVPLSGSRNLKVDAGQFVTHVGYETIEVGTNNFFSRNFLFQFPARSTMRVCAPPTRSAPS